MSQGGRNGKTAEAAGGISLMERSGYGSLAWNWIQRRVLRRSVAPLIPPVPRLEDWIREAATRSNEPPFPSAAADALTRQLNAVTPWHVRVEVQALPGCVVTKVRSIRWLGSSGMVGGGEDPETDLVNVLHHVQGFMANHSKLAWPSTRRLNKDHEGDPVEWLSRLPEPDVAIEDGEMRLWFGDRERPVLELEPIALPTTHY